MKKRIGILTSGGDCPGLNATIRGVAKACFEKFGEDTFRRHETAALNSLGMQSGKVIATGGGCVTRCRNYPLLHQNGTIFWIHRGLDVLPTDGRPLSQSTPIGEMYRKRKPLYEAFADYEISNDGDLSETVGQITAIWEESI